MVLCNSDFSNSTCGNSKSSNNWSTRPVSGVEMYHVGIPRPTYHMALQHT